MPLPTDPAAPTEAPSPPLPGPTALVSWDPVLVQRIKDEEHLRLLSICHYVVGGLAILFSSFFIVHILFGTMMLSHSRFFDSPSETLASPTPADSPASIPSRRHPANHHEPPEFFGYVMIGFGSAVVLLGWTFGALLLYSGRCLARHTRRTLSMVVAGIGCLQVPLGTILGVFTLTVLQRPTVRALYTAAGSEPSLAPAR